MVLPEQRPSRVTIAAVEPSVEGGNAPVKRVVGDTVEVEAHVFADGHDQLYVALLFAYQQDQSWSRVRMEPLGNDRWKASFPVDQIGRYQFTVRAEIDRFSTWRQDTLKKADARQDVSVDVSLGLHLLQAAAAAIGDRNSQPVREAESRLREVSTRSQLLKLLTHAAFADLPEQLPMDPSSVTHQPFREVSVDPPLARFSTWYELFPRSFARPKGSHGTLKDVERQLDRIASMGFDVLYLPPIHPIGTTDRKGRNGRIRASKTDVGSPWAIGSAEGGHKAVHPKLGTVDDVRSLVAAARQRGIEVALDIAYQCSPDHPYLTEHPDWFKRRPDGSIQHAENPPKKYQDIVPFDFECDEWAELWVELKSIVDHWIDQGVRVFRVDNPHTKPMAFWEWMIPAVKEEHPDALFLSEAFTRPKIMHRLAALGFSQSYTYFTWRNSKEELSKYLDEVCTGPGAEYFRPNLWPNTPDILTEYLQAGGRPAFAARLVLAATGSASYGIYGPAFELCERVPRELGSEEYLDSEKYQLRRWDLDRRDDNLTELIALVNQARRENPALQRNDTLRFHETDNPQLICYSKRTPDRSNVVLVVVNLDPHHRQAGWVVLDLDELGLLHETAYQAHDLITDARYLWQGGRNYVELDPASIPAHIFRIRRRTHTEQDFDYFA